MQASRIKAPLAPIAMLAFTLVGSTAHAAQSPECAKASAARAAHSPEYPALQRACEATRGKGKRAAAPPPKPVAPPPRRPAGQPARPQSNSFFNFQVNRNPARPGPSPAPRRAATRPIVYAPGPAAAPAPAAPAPAPAPAAPAAAPAPMPVAAVPVSPNPAAVSATPPPAAADPERVFGLRLGETLRVPACREDAARDTALMQSLKSKDAPAQRMAGTCRLAPEALNGNARLFAQRLANVTADPLPAGVDFSLVAIATQRCPDWANAAGGCVAGVTTKDNQIIGVAYLAGDDSYQAGIEKSLSEKYATAAELKTGTPCQDPKLGPKSGQTRVWDRSGLRVSYFPTGGLTCQQGRVLVETGAMRELFPAPVKR